MSARVMTQYLQRIVAHLEGLHEKNAEAIQLAARLVADQVKSDKIVYAYGPGGHSNIGSQELFFRSGGLMHVSAMLDEGTLLSGGALRSMAIERTPGYGKIVIDDYNLSQGDLLILINAYGINAAVIDAAQEARRRGVKIIGVTSVQHAQATAAEHPARHPSKKNLYEIVDVVLDSNIEVGDAVITIEGIDQPVGPLSTFATAYLLNSMVAEAVNLLAQEGVQPPIWRSGNAPDGDEVNARFIDRFKGRIKKL
ncbi:MAG TPA: SIS domain-containing protein [Ktedonobacteraceae bacterium]|jgi:uncharacterized phosphosugar-binding protein|nr:SIS domain-containing protein [Ktedonobacteraceae bacterium]